MKKIYFLILLFALISANAYAVMNPVGASYNLAGITHYAVNAVHNKLYLVNVGTIYTMDLYPDSGTLASGAVPVQTISCTTATIGGLAIDAMKKKLYVCAGAMAVYIYNISDTGMIVGTPYYQPHHWADGWSVDSLFLDFVNNRVFTSGQGWGTNGFVVSQLGSDGMPTDTAGIPKAMGQVFDYPALIDNNVGKIYAGHSSQVIAKRVNLDANGYPLSVTYNEQGSGGWGIVLDAGNARIYHSTGDTIFMRRLDPLGNEVSIDTTQYTPVGPMAIDTVRRRLYTVGVLNYSVAYITAFNLDADGRPVTFVDSGYFNPTSWGRTDINFAYEPVYNKIYAVYVSAGKLVTYNGLDAPLTPVMINNGESLTETPYVTLKFQHSNPAYIYVSGDLLSVGSPVNTLNKWLSCGGTMWRNSGDTMRAGTLNVSTTLSSVLGEKTVEVWYVGSINGGNTTGANFTGMMRKATAKITLIESSARVTSIGLSRIDYSGSRIDYAVTDGRNRNVNVTVQHKTDGKDWSDASMGSNSEGKTELSATLAGVSHYFLWDIEKDIPENAKDLQIRIKADNGDSEGAWTESGKYSVSEWTGNDIKATNASIKKPPGITGAEGVWAYRVRLEWTGITDTSTSYEIQRNENDGNWSFIRTMSGTLTEIEDLSDSPVYSFRVRLRTKEGLFSAYSKTAKIRLTQRQYETKTIGKTGGSIYIEDFDENDANNASMEVESGTFREDVDLTFERFSGGEYEINAKKKNGVFLTEHDFGKPVTIKLKYDREEVSLKGWKEDDLAIYHFDGINWNSIGGKIDKTNCLIIARVNHFSKFKVSVNLTKPVASITPDFFSPNGDGINDIMRIYFSQQNMVDKNEVRIYDVNGKIIRIMKGDGVNTAYWDGRNENGGLCETGLYVVVIEADNQKTTETIRLVK